VSDKVTLYSTTQEFIGLLELMEVQESDPTPEQETAIQETIAAHVRKVDGVAKFMRHMDSQSDLAAAEIKRLQDRKRSIDGHIARFEKYILDCLEMAGMDKFDGETATIARRKNPPAVAKDCEEAIPARFRVIVPERVEVDWAAVKAALKAGVEVPGARLTRGWRLEVK
jgi:hypothetical protein